MHLQAQNQSMDDLNQLRDLPYRCPICLEAFSMASDLMCHMKNCSKLLGSFYGEKFKNTKEDSSNCSMPLLQGHEEPHGQTGEVSDSSLIITDDHTSTESSPQDDSDTPFQHLFDKILQEKILSGENNGKTVHLKNPGKDTVHQTRKVVQDSSANNHKNSGDLIRNILLSNESTNAVEYSVFGQQCFNKLTLEIHNSQHPCDYIGTASVSPSHNTDQIKMEPPSDGKIKLESPSNDDVKVEPRSDREIKTESESPLDSEVKMVSPSYGKIKIESPLNSEIKMEFPADCEIRNEPSFQQEDIVERKAESLGLPVDLMSILLESPSQEDNNGQATEPVSELNPMDQANDNPKITAESPIQSQKLITLVDAVQNALNPHSCTFCNESFPNILYLTTHIEVAHKHAYICKLCDASFPLWRGLSNHSRTHKSFKCPESGCEKVFNQKPHLERHIHAMHRNFNRFSCNLCEKSYFYKSDLKNHFDAVHRKLKPFSCTLCRKTFTLKHSVVNHMKYVHAKVKPFSCTLCDKSFAYNKDLTSHVDAVHYKKKPFSCTLCEKSFPQKPHLVRHVDRVHRKLKPFSCTLCEKSFGYKEDLLIHSKYHTKEKPGHAHTNLITKSKSESDTIFQNASQENKTRKEFRTNPERNPAENVVSQAFKLPIMKREPPAEYIDFFFFFDK